LLLEAGSQDNSDSGPPLTVELREDGSILVDGDTETNREGLSAALDAKRNLHVGPAVTLIVAPNDLAAPLKPVREELRRRGFSELSMRLRPPSLIPEALGTVSASSSPLASVEEDPVDYQSAKANLEQGADFVFVLGQGSGRDGFNTLQIDATRHAVVTYTANGAGKYRRLQFRLSNEEYGALRSFVLSQHFFDLKKAYRANTNDGTQWFVRVRVTGLEKRVYCDNHFPREVIAISEFVRTNIVEDRLVPDAGAPLGPKEAFDHRRAWD
jgi:hypothetical protein